MYILHPNILSQVVIDFGGKEILSDTEQEVQSLSKKVYRKREGI